jgi:phage gp45-like
MFVFHVYVAYVGGLSSHKLIQRNVLAITINTRKLRCMGLHTGETVMKLA